MSASVAPPIAPVSAFRKGLVDWHDLELADEQRVRSASSLSLRSLDAGCHVYLVGTPRASTWFILTAVHPLKPGQGQGPKPAGARAVGVSAGRRRPLDALQWARIRLRIGPWPAAGLCHVRPGARPLHGPR